MSKAQKPPRRGRGGFCAREVQRVRNGGRSRRKPASFPGANGVALPRGDAGGAGIFRRGTSAGAAENEATRPARRASLAGTGRAPARTQGRGPYWWGRGAQPRGRRAGQAVRPGGNVGRGDFRFHAARRFAARPCGEMLCSKQNGGPLHPDDCPGGWNRIATTARVPARTGGARRVPRYPRPGTNGVALSRGDAGGAGIFRRGTFAGAAENEATRPARRASLAGTGRAPARTQGRASTVSKFLSGKARNPRGCRTGRCAGEPRLWRTRRDFVPAVRRSAAQTGRSDPCRSCPCPRRVISPNRRVGAIRAGHVRARSASFHRTDGSERSVQVMSVPAARRSAAQTGRSDPCRSCPCPQRVAPLHRRVGAIHAGHVRARGASLRRASEVEGRSGDGLRSPAVRTAARSASTPLFLRPAGFPALETPARPYKGCNFPRFAL